MYYYLVLLQLLTLFPLTTSYTVDQLWTLTTHFWDNFLYPANTAHINPNDTSIFSDNVPTSLTSHTRSSPSISILSNYRSKAASTSPAPSPTATSTTNISSVSSLKPPTLASSAFPLPTTSPNSQRRKTPSPPPSSSPSTSAPSTWSCRG